ncbi:MAG: hypothetical protein HY774_03785 [Acidobacteria bacterium]|nr:hypothetical protein [Acidobacteriota bacterium]
MKNREGRNSVAERLLELDSFRPDGRRKVAGGLPLWAHHRIFGPILFAPGRALENCVGQIFSIL